mmetsp:Transcript_2142/g.5120  ORF Transcript_2142/g.5120 Transcript_2142/m.5120 type:complete len:170 (-) Transcript_2142:157-666(-)
MASRPAGERSRGPRPPLVSSTGVLAVAVGGALGASLIDCPPTFVCAALSVFFPLAGPMLAADLLGSDITSASLSCFLGWLVMKLGTMLASLPPFVSSADEGGEPPLPPSTGLASVFGVVVAVMLVAVAAELREKRTTVEWRIHLVACSGCALLCSFITSLAQLAAWLLV